MKKLIAVSISACIASISLAQHVHVGQWLEDEGLATKIRTDQRKMFELMAKGRANNALDYLINVAEKRERIGALPWERRDLAFEIGDFAQAHLQNELCRGSHEPDYWRATLDFYQELIRAESTGQSPDWARFDETHDAEFRAVALLPAVAQGATKHFQFRLAERALVEYERMVHPLISRDIRTKMTDRKELQRKIIRGEAEVPYPRTWNRT